MNHSTKTPQRAVLAATAACLLFLCARGEALQAQSPTLENVPYGPHPRQVLDFYKANSKGPAPVFFFMHSGGWMNGDKKDPGYLQNALAAGVSVVSVEYRMIPDAAAAKVSPPVKVCLDDAARALQFVRSRAREWNLDPQQVCASGASAGGFMALWLAFHPDLARPSDPDPVAHQSTRVRCVLAINPQTSLDPLQLRQWVPNNDYGHHAFLLPSYQDFLAKRTPLLPWIKEFSPYELATPDDPPVYLNYDTPPTPGQPAKDPPHSANLGVGLAEKLKSIGVSYELNYPGAPNVKHPDPFAFVTSTMVVASPAHAVAAVPAHVDAPASASGVLFDLGDLTSIKTDHAAVSQADGSDGQKILQASFEPGFQYTSVEFPLAGARDLSASTGVETEVTNLGPGPAKVVLRVDDDGDWHKEPFNSEAADVPPGETRTIAVTFGRSFGAAGYPLNSSRITRLLIIVASPSERTTLQITKLAAAGH